MAMIEADWWPMSEEQAQEEWDKLTSFSHWAGQQVGLHVEVVQDPVLGEIAVIDEAA